MCLNQWVKPSGMTALRRCFYVIIWFIAPRTTRAMRSGAGTRRAPGRAIPPASASLSAAAGQGPASRRLGPQLSSQPSWISVPLRPVTPHALLAAWTPRPSSGHRPVRPARHQEQCVGRGEARPGSKPMLFSTAQARRWCTGPTTPFRQRSHGWRRSSADEGLDP
jgi:hypothetical protein